MFVIYYIGIARMIWLFFFILVYELQSGGILAERFKHQNYEDLGGR